MASSWRAVTNDGRALAFADAALKRDRDVAMAAVQQNSMALLSVDPSLKADPKLVDAAIASDNAKKALPHVILWPPHFF